MTMENVHILNNGDLLDNLLDSSIKNRNKRSGLNGNNMAMDC